MSQTLGSILRQIRSIKNFTLREVEKETRISNSYLNQLENDKIKDPSPRTLYTLAEFYKISYTKLLSLAGYVVPGKKDGYKQLSGVAKSTIGDLTPEEEEKVLEYIEFLRSRKR